MRPRCAYVLSTVLRWLACLSFLVVLVPLTRVAAQGETRLGRVLQEVRDRSPSHAAARARVAAARAELSAAGRPADPMLAIETDGWGSDQELGSRMVRYTLEQPIPIPGTLGAEERVAAAGIDRAASEVETTLRDLELETVRAYAMLWQAQGELAVVESQVGLLEDLAASALARMRAGADAHHDVIQAQVEQLALQNRATSLRAERDGAAAMLNALRDRPAGAPIVAAALPALPETLPSEDALVRRALRDRPELRSMQAMAREEREMARLMRLDAWPMLRAGVWYTQDLGMADSVGVMVAGTLPIFGAPRQLARADAAEARAGAADRERAQMEAMIRAEVRRAMARYSAAHERLGLLRDVALARAEQALLAAQSSYRSGMMPFASVIQDRRMLAELRMELVGAEAARLVAWGDLMRAVGADLGSEVPR